MEGEEKNRKEEKKSLGKTMFYLAWCFVCLSRSRGCGGVKRVVRLIV